MKLFTSKNSSHKTKHMPNILQGLGYTPMADWVMILLVSLCIMVIISAFSISRYFHVHSIIENLPEQNNSNNAGQIKTKEEKLKDLVDLYTKRKQRHLLLLGESKATVTQDVIESNSVATSTGTSTTSIDR